MPRTRRRALVSLAPCTLHPNSKKQAKLTGMPPTPGQLESMGLLGYIVGGGNGLDLINVGRRAWLGMMKVATWKESVRLIRRRHSFPFQRVLKECIEQGVPLPENLLVVGHATAK